MAKKLEIVGLFNNSQIRRAFGDMIADTSKAKTTWSEMVTKMKSGEKEISSAIQDNIKQIKDKERAIDSLNRKMSNSMNSSFRSGYEQQVQVIDKKIASLKRQNAELERTARYEKAMTFRSATGAVGGVIGSGLRAGATAIGAAGVAGAAIMGRSFSNYMPVDQQIGLLDATLRPKTGTTKDQVKGQIFGTSTKYGKDAAEVAASYTQLFSSGMMPTATEGTAEYTKQMDEAGRVLDEVAKASAATGESMTSMQSALVFTANAFGRDIHSVTDVKEVLDAMGTTLDLGIGTMSQYTAEFSKFSPAAKVAQASMKESMAVFALMTQSYGAAEAGHATKQFFEESGNSARYMTRSSNVLTRMGKSGLVVGTDSDKAILGKFAAKGTGAKALNDYFVDAKGNTKPLIETLKEVNTTYKKLNSDSAKNAFISAMGAMNANMVKTWRVMTGEAMVNENGEMVKGTGVDKLSNFIEQYEKTGVMDAKIAQVQEHMSFKMQQLGKNWSNGMYKFIDAAEPTIDSMISFLTKAAGYLGPIGERINYALGNLPAAETEKKQKILDAQRATLDSGGTLPTLLSSNVGYSDRQELYKQIDPLFDKNNGSGLGIHDIVDKMLLNGAVDKNDIVRAYGKNAPTAIDKISNTLTNTDGAGNWAVGTVAKLLGVKGEETSQYVTELQNLSTILQEKNKIAEKQQADANIHLSNQTALLQVIASKDFSFSSPIAAFLGGLGSGGKDVKPGATPVATK